METEETLTKMKNFAEELNSYLLEGKSLKEVMKITYERREKGENIPYMAVGTTAKGEVLDLYAQPINSQRELKRFFSQKRIGSKFLTVSLSMDKSGVYLKL